MKKLIFLLILFFMLFFSYGCEKDNGDLGTIKVDTIIFEQTRYLDCIDLSCYIDTVLCKDKNTFRIYAISYYSASSNVLTKHSRDWYWRKVLDAKVPVEYERKVLYRLDSTVYDTVRYKVIKVIDSVDFGIDVLSDSIPFDVSVLPDNIDTTSFKHSRGVVITNNMFSSTIYDTTLTPEEYTNCVGLNNSFVRFVDNYFRIVSRRHCLEGDSCQFIYSQDDHKYISVGRIHHHVEYIN